MTSTESRRHPPALSETELKQEFDAHFAALRELGPGYTDTVAASLMEQIQHLVDARIDARLAARDSRPDRVKVVAPALALAIPLTAIAGGIAGTAGIVVVWVAILIIIFRA